MEKNDKEMELRFVDAMNNQAQATQKMASVLERFIENNNAIIENVSKLNRFAADTFNKVNDSTIVLDAISVCLFETGVIKQERFQEVFAQLKQEHEQRLEEQYNEAMKTQKHNCGGCDEDEGKANSPGAES